MTTEREHCIRAFEYARGKVKSGEWSWDMAGGVLLGVATHYLIGPIESLDRLSFLIYNE